MSAAPMSTLEKIRALNRAYVVDRQGKDHVIYAGLLDYAHQNGLKRITTKLLEAPSEANGHTTIIWSEVEVERGTFCGIGDANANNVGRMIAMHCPRMAETRSKARALRDAFNIGGAALEELGPEEDAAPAKAETPAASPVQQPQRPAEAKPSAAPTPAAPAAQAARTGSGKATPQQIERLGKLRVALGQPAQVPADLSFDAATEQITELVRQFNNQARTGRAAPPTQEQVTNVHTPASEGQRARIAVLRALLGQPELGDKPITAAQADQEIRHWESLAASTQADEAQWANLTAQAQRIHDRYGVTPELPGETMTIAEYERLILKLREQASALNAKQPAPAGK